MMEKIINIEAHDGIEIGAKSSSRSDDWCGYTVTTDKQIIYVVIDNDAQCCENWGYFCSEDDPSYYVGANLRNIMLVDDALNVKAVEKSGASIGDNGWGRYGSVQFVNFETDKGTFQLAVYNEHNGYYSHNIKILSNQVKHESAL